MSTVSLFLESPRQAYEAIREQWQKLKAHMRMKGASARVTVETIDPRRRRKQRAALHGPILRTIAEQVWLYDPHAGCRVRYHPEVWKRYFASLFLEPNLRAYTDPDTGEICWRISTEAVGDDRMALFLTEVQAWAVTELNVTFPEDDDYE